MAAVIPPAWASNRTGRTRESISGLMPARAASEMAPRAMAARASGALRPLLAGVRQQMADER